MTFYFTVHTHINGSLTIFSDPLFRRPACSVCSKPKLRQCMTLCNKCVRLGRVDKCEAIEIEVVYHLQGKIGWSTVCVNGKQNSRKGNSF